jgi:hypothetical protein
MSRILLAAIILLSSVSVSKAVEVPMTPAKVTYTVNGHQQVAYSASPTDRPHFITTINHVADDIVVSQTVYPSRIACDDAADTIRIAVLGLPEVRYLKRLPETFCKPIKEKK